MAIKGKTILLGRAYCKQAERKVERVRDAAWRGAENEESSEETREREGERWQRTGRPELHILFTLQILILFKWLLVTTGVVLHRTATSYLQVRK